MDERLDDNLTPPSPPELPPAGEYDQIAAVIDGYLKDMSKWAADYAVSVRDDINSIDIAWLKGEIEDLRGAMPKRDGLEMLAPLRDIMPTLGPGIQDRTVGSEGVGIASVPGMDVAMAERPSGLPGPQLHPEEMQWGVATAPDVRTETGTDAPAHIMPGATIKSYVYLWPGNSDGESSTAAPALTSETTDQFIKAYWRGHESTINIRGTDVVSYIESDGKYWIEGDWGDRAVDSLDFKDSAVSDERGWYHCDGRSGANAPFRASADLADAGTAYNLPDYRQVYLALSGTSGTHPSSPPPTYVLPVVNDAGDVADTTAGMDMTVDQYGISGMYGAYLQGMKRIN